MDDMCLAVNSLPARERFKAPPAQGGLPQPEALRSPDSKLGDLPPPAWPGPCLAPAKSRSRSPAVETTSAGAAQNVGGYVNFFHRAQLPAM